MSLHRGSVIYLYRTLTMELWLAAAYHFRALMTLFISAMHSTLYVRSSIVTTRNVEIVHVLSYTFNPHIALCMVLIDTSKGSSCHTDQLAPAYVGGHGVKTVMYKSCLPLSMGWGPLGGYLCIDLCAS